MSLFFRKGQTTLEYAIVLVIIIAALLSMQIYFRRGLQGRWKDSVDQVGEQYNPGTTNAAVTHVLYTTADTRLKTMLDTAGGVNGYFTMRSDSSTMTETKQGVTQVGY